MAGYHPHHGDDPTMTGCVDSILGTQLSAPLYTTASATVATPLTSLAWVLHIVYNISLVGTSEVISSSFGLGAEDVWSFDALEAYMLGIPPQDPSNAMWIVRQVQVLNAVSCSMAVPALLAARDRNGTAVVSYALYAALANLLLTAEGAVALAELDTLLAIIQATPR